MGVGGGQLSSAAARNAIMSRGRPREVDGGARRQEREGTAGGAGTGQPRPTILWLELTGVRACVQCSAGALDVRRLQQLGAVAAGEGRAIEQAGRKRVYVTLVSVAMRRCCSAPPPPPPPLRSDVGKEFLGGGEESWRLWTAWRQQVGEGEERGRGDQGKGRGLMVLESPLVVTNKDPDWYQGA